MHTDKTVLSTEKQQKIMIFYTQYERFFSSCSYNTPNKKNNNFLFALSFHLSIRFTFLPVSMDFMDVPVLQQ